VTLPLQPPTVSPFLVPAFPASPVRFPLGWLLDHASPGLRSRSICEVARLPVPPLVAALPMAEPLALRLAVTQQPDGSWGPSMLGVPSSHGGVAGLGMINGVRRLLEYGWDRESPPLVRARRLLFRLLAEDDDPAYLFELRAEAAGNEDLVRRGRGILREAAAAALAQAGYEGDPRLRGAARRILERIMAYLRSPLAQKPWMRVGNRQVLAPDAVPPSIYVLTMLAHMPLFRNEHHGAMERLYQYLTQPLPRQESMQLYGEEIVAQPHLVLGDQLPHRNAADADAPSALLWLELMARLNFLRRHDGWSRLFDRFLDDRDRGGVWHPHKGLEGPATESPFVWPYFPLESDRGAEGRWTDVTFRLGLIARLTGRPIEVE